MKKNTLRQLVVSLLASAMIAGSATAADMAVPCSGDAADPSRSASASAPAAKEQWRYPREAMRQRAEGTVMLQVLLDADGSTTEVKLAASSGSSVLDRAALKAAKNARFCKLKAPSEAMAGLAEVSVHYSLNVAVARL